VGHDTLAAAQQKLERVRDELNTLVLEGEDRIDVMLAALLARQHVVLLGPPGVAKSMLARLAAARLPTGANSYFEWLMTRFSTPDELFGTPKMSALQQDRLERNTDGKLPTASIVFLDEVFKGSGIILNTLLSAMQDRVFHNGSGAQKIPLQTLIGASNEMPADDESGALWDRFLFRMDLRPLQTDAAREALFSLPGGQVQHAFTADELAALQHEVDRRVRSDDRRALITPLLTLQTQCRDADIEVSDRRIRQAMRACAAWSVVMGDDALHPGTLDVLKWVLWNTPDQQAAVSSMVEKAIDTRWVDLRRTRTDLARQVADFGALNLSAQAGFDRAVTLFETAERLQDAAQRHANELGTPSAAKIAAAVAGMVQRMDDALVAARAGTTPPSAVAPAPAPVAEPETITTEAPTPAPRRRGRPVPTSL